VFLSISSIYHPLHPRVVSGLDVGEQMSWWRVDRMERMDAGGASPSPNSTRCQA